jgi:hypothetical protein
VTVNQGNSYFGSVQNLYRKSKSSNDAKVSEVMGLISIGDVVRETIAYQKSMIEQLQSYIAG